jgi:hypothetical protein
MTSDRTTGGRSDQAGSRSRRSRRARGERGVALVEFAIVAPLFFLLIFGIVEFGWGFYQKIDVRHGAREGARLAAVDFGGGDIDDLVAEICDRMDASSTDGVDIAITKGGSGDIGDDVTIRVQKRLDTLTGFLDPFIGNALLDSEIKTRLEQDASYANEPAESLPGNDCP